MFKMNEYRCYNCNNILCKATEGLDIEVICPKCRRINYPARKRVGIGLSGKDFNAKSINNNCPQCKRLLLKTIGFGYIELKCCNKKCNWIGIQDTLKIREKVSNMTKITIDKLREKMNTYIVDDKQVDSIKKAEQEAKEKAEQEVREKAEQEAKEKAEQEAREKAEQDISEDNNKKNILKNKKI